MIDFRYHVVSLVSVFMALAVGIVLGAGPLNEGISTGITDQVRQLTEDRNQMRTERDAALATAEAQDSWAQTVGPALVARQLGGRAVAVVELPGADASQTDAAVDELTTAGATISARVTVQSKWTDPDEATFRSQLAAQLAGQLTSAPDTAAGTDALLAAELGRALLTTDLVQGAEPDTAGPAILSALGEGGLVQVDGQVTTRGTLVLLVGGAPDADATDDQVAAVDQAWTALAAGLDAASAGAVVAGPAEAAEDGGPVSAVREDQDTADAVSTVDGLDTAIGRVSTVLALRQQLSGESGQYGTAGSATAVSPPLPAAAQ